MSAQPDTGLPASDLPAAPEAASRHTLALEAGGTSLAFGARYERAFGRRLRASVGYSHFTTGRYFAVSTHTVPIAVNALQPLSARWSLDAGGGVMVFRSTEEAGVQEFPGQDFVIVSKGESQVGLVPNLTAGVRFEGRRGFARIGAVLFVVPPKPYEGWRAVPWPSLSAGVRF